MNIAEIAIKRRVVTWVLTAFVVVAGIGSYNSMGRLEDPEYTIKQAIITTAYPGATAQQVESLDARGALVEHGNPRIAHDLLHAPLLDKPVPAVYLDADIGRFIAGFGNKGLADRGNRYPDAAVGIFFRAAAFQHDRQNLCR